MNGVNTVWLIDEGHAGHRVQAEGVLKALERAGLSLKIEKIDCVPSLRGIFRPLARAIFSRLDGPGATKLAHQVASFTEPDDPHPTFIISSGGRSAFVSRALALKTGAPNIFVGDPGPFPRDWFSVVLSAVPLAQGASITTGIVPNVVTPQECLEKAQDYWQGSVPEGRWVLLLGGASRSHPYNLQDWRDIANSVNALAARHEIKWLISTSRRTSEEVEAFLKKEISPDAVEELVLYGQQPKKVVLPFLGTAEKVFVTRDSLTMVSEAIMSGKPVTALMPRRVALPPDSFLAAVLNNYASWDRYTELRCAALVDFVPPPATSSDPHQAIAELDRAALELMRTLDLAAPTDETAA